MASASLVVPPKEKNKNPQSAKIVLLPAPREPVKAIICAGTGLPCPTAFFGDRAQNAFPFLNPYIGMLTMLNLHNMSMQTRAVDSDLPEMLFPGITTRLISMIQKNLTRSKGVTYDQEHVERKAVGIKGRSGPHQKFLQALNLDLTSGPLVWTPETKRPFLPVSMALAAGYDWCDILTDLRDLIDRAEAFTGEWEWHGESLKMTGEELHAKRQKRRAKKSSSEDEAAPTEDD